MRHLSRSQNFLPSLRHHTMTSSPQRHLHTPPRHGSFPAIFARGGTSNGLLIHAHHLPPQSEWHSILPAAMGSPDPCHGRQLNGMGSGISSTSKICVLAPSSRPEADVEFTFVQVGVRDGVLDTAGNCGNMASVVGPVAWDEGVVDRERVRVDGEDGAGYRTALARVFNTNTAKVVHARFRVAGEPARYCAEGEYEMDGVPGRQSRVVLSFVDPGGAKTGRCLPTGNAVDVLGLEDGSAVEASLVDVSNPGVFVRVADLGVQDPELLDPASVEADGALKARLEMIRQAGAVRMGLDPKTESVPKIVLVFSPRNSHSEQQSPRVNIRCLALSMGQAHKAVPLTLALCLGAATRLPGTIPHQLVAGAGEGGAVVIGHPSGRLEVGTTVENGQVLSAELHRTARVLMKGEVFY